MAGVKSKAPAVADASPTSLPSGSPPFSGHQDHSFTLQTVMELNKTVGVLTASIDGLRRDVEAQTKSLGELRTDIVSIKMKIYAAGVLLTVLVACGGFIVNKAWDMMVKQIQRDAAALVAPVQPQPQAPK